MHLEPGAVELPLHRRGADPLEGLARALGGLREHRLQGPQDLEPEPRQPRLPIGKRGRRDHAEIAREHEGAPHVRDGDAGGARHRVGDDALERALTELAVEECAEEPLFGLGRTGEELGDRATARPLRSGAARSPDRPERRVDLEKLERRAFGRRREVAERRPADADRPVRKGAGQVRDGDGRLVRARSAKTGGEGSDLGGARRRLRDGGGRPGDLVEEHRRRLSRLGGRQVRQACRSRSGRPGGAPRPPRR